MSWVEWLKEWADRRPGRSAGAPARPTPASRARQGGEAYAQEWVKVLEHNGPERNAFDTYTWELDADATAAQQAAAPPARKAANQPPTDPFDTFTWEVPETDSRDDPWGLKKQAAEAAKPTKKDGINPYDTGVFEAGWTGRFDKR